MAFVIVRSSLELTGTKLQHWLDAIQRLDLGFLVNRQCRTEPPSTLGHHQPARRLSSPNDPAGSPNFFAVRNRSLDRFLTPHDHLLMPAFSNAATRRCTHGRIHPTHENSHQCSAHTDRKALLAEREQIRVRGIAKEVEAYIEGICSFATTICTYMGNFCNHCSSPRIPGQSSRQAISGCAGRHKTNHRAGNRQ